FFSRLLWHEMDRQSRADCAVAALAQGISEAGKTLLHLRDGGISEERHLPAAKREQVLGCDPPPEAIVAAHRGIDLTRPFRPPDHHRPIVARYAVKHVRLVRL